MAGIPYNTLYSIVRRNSDRINLDLARNLSLALNVSPLEFLGDDVLEWVDFGEEVYKRASTDSEEFTYLDNQCRLDEAIRKAYNIKGDYVIVEVGSKTSGSAEPTSVDILMQLSSLNYDGQKKVTDYIDDLVSSKRYQREETTPSSAGKEKPPEEPNTPSDGDNEA